MSDGEPPSFSVTALAQRAREQLASALVILQQEPQPAAHAQDAISHAACASSSLYRVQAEARLPAAAIADIHAAAARLGRALSALSISRTQRADHEIAAAAIARALALLQPITLATQRKRRRVLAGRELSDVERDVLKRPRAASGPPRDSNVPVAGERRRGHPRARFQISVELYSESQFQSALSVDISPGGVFVSTQQPLALGSEVTLQFLLPGGRAVEARGEVCWARPAGGREPPGMGVRFVNLSGEDLSKIWKASE